MGNLQDRLKTKETRKHRLGRIVNKENLQRETEVLFVASQDEATLTTYIKAKVDKSHVDHKCRM